MLEVVDSVACATEPTERPRDLLAATGHLGSNLARIPVWSSPAGGEARTPVPRITHAQAANGPVTHFEIRFHLHMEKHVTASPVSATRSLCASAIWRSLVSVWNLYLSPW